MSPSRADAEPAASADHGLAEVVEELTAKLKAGAAVDWQAYFAAYPQHAGELHRLLPTLRLLAAFSHSAASDGCAASAGVHEAASPDGTLGDFRIVREIGRGGMGVVYEAAQISLGRRVALKILPFASTLDPKQIQRFKNEAQAAAQLHHTNIVPVHATGCERGVYYYAMQFIEGQTLAQIIAQLRQPTEPRPQSGLRPLGSGEQLRDKTLAYALPPDSRGADATPPVAVLSTEHSIKSPAYFRSVAQIGVQAAQALEHAHQLGIVHRDIKPANLLIEHLALTTPSSPRLWITDFGLAHCQNQAGLTMSGDLVGTLRYMSPEQALAKRVLVDQRTDVYSLGATLYELLTLRPALGGTDRQELLRKIAFEEPVRPRSLDQQVPAELETVVLKALEKNPAERYATAQELADDLHRFLEDQPIRARRPTVVQRVRKWARRHQPVVRTTAAAVILMASLLAGGALWLVQKQAARRADTERAVTTAVTRAETLLAEGDKQTEDATRWRSTVQLAVSAVERAEELAATGGGTEELAQRVRQAREAVAAAETDSRLLAELERIRLEKGVFKLGPNDNVRPAPLYAEHLSSYGVDLAAPEAAAAKVRGSRLREALLAALEVWRQASPDEQERQRLSEVIEAAEPPDAFRARWRSAAREGDRAQLVKLSTEAPVQYLSAAAICGLAWDLRYGRPGLDLEREREWAAAERLLRRAQLRKPDDFWLNYDLGRLLYDYPDATDAFPTPVGPISLTAKKLRRIIGLGQAETFPAPVGSGGGSRLEEAVGYYRVALALRSDSPGIYHCLGSALLCTGDLEGAIGCYEAALRLEPHYAGVHQSLAIALDMNKNPDGAIREYRAALRIDSKLFTSHNNLGYHLYVKQQREEALREFQAAVAIAPNIPQAHAGLGLALHDKGDLEGAIREFEAVVAFWPVLAEAHSDLGALLCERGDWKSAVREYAEAFATWLKLSGHPPPGKLSAAARVAALASCGQSQAALAVEHAHHPGVIKDANRLGDQERAGLRNQALEWLRADLKRWRRVLEKGPDTTRPRTAEEMQDWLEDPAFAGVRGEKALANLPAEEGPGWRQLWAEVEQTLAQAREQPNAKEKSQQN
jgi:serine/threonine protein kinase/tetratricopeptide (TPR) repeat protein